MADSGVISPGVSLSEKAAQRILSIVNADPAVAGLRLAVEGGGCSGFQYDMQLAPGPAAEDVTIERDGAKLFVDAISLPYLAGAEIDWAEELIGAAFKVNNPNAKTECGCGVSFSV
jgi:iron-sulfur cluster assembly accessory protein